MRSTTGWVPAVALALGLSGCGGGLAFQTDCPAVRDPGRGEYAIGVADTLAINVWQNADLSFRGIVRPDGIITMPLVGELRAAGRTPTQLQEDITRMLTRFVTTATPVTVTVADIASYRVYVLGQVTTPGELRPRTPVKVLQALALAGGLTRFANADEIVIVRHAARGQCRIPFSMSWVMERGRLDLNETLESGDTIVVP
jgi:polysaccharide export outer membrane protein